VEARLAGLQAATHHRVVVAMAQVADLQAVAFVEFVFVAAAALAAATAATVLAAAAMAQAVDTTAKPGSVA